MNYLSILSVVFITFLYSYSNKKTTITNVKSSSTISQRINLKITNHKYKDKALLVTGPSFTNDKDYGYDAIKFFGTQALSIFFYYKGEKYAISAFKNSTKFSMQVGIDITYDQEIQFSLDATPTLINDNLVYLRDTKTDSLYNLSTTPISFNATPNDTYRFVLIVQQHEEETQWTNGQWTNGIPNDSTSIIFRENYTINSNISGKDITINENTTITIDSLKKLTVTGNILNKGNGFYGSGTLELFNHKDTLSFIDSTNITGIISLTDSTILNTNQMVFLKSGAIIQHKYKEHLIGHIHVERAGNTDPLAYNYWSLPITNKSEVTKIGTHNKYIYNEPATKWDIFNDTIIVSGQGFISTGAGLISIIGTPHADSISYPVTAQGGYFDFGNGFTNNQGFNLIGNPFLAPLNYQSFVTSNPQVVDGALYFYKGNANGTGYYSTINRFNNRSIPSFQGFFIKVLEDTSVFFLHEQKSTVGNKDLFRKVNEFSIEKFIIHINSQQYQDQIIVGISPDFTPKNDYGYDAIKRYGDQPFSIASIKDGNYFSSLALHNKDSIEVPILINSNTDFSINLKAFTSSYHIHFEDSNSNIYLFDEKGNINIKTNTEKKSIQFKLVFVSKKTITNINSSTTENWNIFLSKDNIKVYTSTPSNKYINISIKSIDGKTIWEKNYRHENQLETLTITPNKITNEGIIIQLKGDNINITRKYIIMK